MGKKVLGNFCFSLGLYASEETNGEFMLLFISDSSSAPIP